MLTNYVTFNENDLDHRKALTNERMFKLQHMTTRLHKKIKALENENKEIKDNLAKAA